MKKYICLMMLHWLITTPAFSQVVMNLQLPAIGLTLKSQLWNLSVVNTGTQEIQAQLQVLLTNVSTNQKVLSGTTRLLTLPRGLLQVQANDVKPVTYNVLDPSTGIDASQEGFLPIGVYDVCYSVMKIGSDFSEQLAEECVTVEIEPLSPPQLIFPVDLETISDNRPYFSWLPPTPFQHFQLLTYNFKLVEVISPQSSTDAIQQNLPITSGQNIPSNSYQYPISLPALDTGKWYAWQISALSGGNSIANSETWIFRVRAAVPNAQPLPSQENYYTRLKQELDASYTSSGDIIRFEYYNEWNDAQAGLRLYDITNANRTSISLDSSLVKLEYGTNLRKINMSLTNRLTQQHLYLLELINSKNEHWYFKFEYRKP